MSVYWDTASNLELTDVIFVRAHWEFSIYLDSLKQIVPWFFYLGLCTITMPVHICDMENLSTTIL